MKHILESEGLFILSGPPSSGKSSIAKTVLAQAPEALVSTDDVRKMLLGSTPRVNPENDNVSNFIYGWDQNNEKTFNIIRNILETRLINKLPTILDAQNLTDDVRSEFVKMAEKYGVKAEILIIDCELDKCIEFDKKRPFSVGQEVIENSYKKLQKTSKYPYRVIKYGDTLEFSCLQLSSKVDVVGDIHGLKDETFQLLKKAGYIFDKNEMPVHPEGRKLVFLGDFLDRGQQSVPLLQWMYKICQAGHYCLIGNHELKLAAHYEMKEKKDLRIKSISSGETFNEFMKLSGEEQEKLYKFLKQMPCRAEIITTINGKEEKVALTHANITTFDPINLPLSMAAYGTSKREKSINSDKSYNKGYKLGINKHILLRGHILPTDEENDFEYIHTLEAKQAYKGNLLLLPIDNWLEQAQSIGYKKAFEQLVVKQKSEFDFNEHNEKVRKMQTQLRNLKNKKLVTENIEPEYGLSLFKYSKNVFWDNLWHKDPMLFKARGIVLDITGNIVQHPFDKIFNYGENDTGKSIQDDQKVQWVEKLNGFLGCITKHPFKNDLLVTSSGSFESDFVGYIKDFINNELRGKLIKFYQKNDLTLMFEVIHPKDPHIIPYENKEQGLWLIGARGKEQNAQLKTEEELDVIAQEIGVRRPKYGMGTLGDIKEQAKTSNLEGWILRDPINHEPILKIKTDFYLTTKFIGRMGEKNIKEMFGNPKNFKKKVDEEFEFLVDEITNSMKVDRFIALTKEERIEIVRGLINKYYKNDQNTETLKKTNPSM